MFDIGEVVWVEYDGSEAFVGQIMSLDDDEVMMMQVVEFKVHRTITERLVANATDSVNSLPWDAARAQFLSYMGVLGLPWLVLGEQAVRTKLLWLVADQAIANGQGYLRTLDEPMRVVLPRSGAVFKDAKVAVDAMIGKSGKSIEEAVDAEVAAFRDSLDEFTGIDSDDPEGTVSGNHEPPEPDNQPGF